MVIVVVLLCGYSISDCCCCVDV